MTKIKEVRAAKTNTLLLDAGDQFQGTVWFNIYNGQEAAHFMNMLGYDAQCVHAYMHY
jgi:5'-nucleotidase